MSDGEKDGEASSFDPRARRHHRPDDGVAAATGTVASSRRRNSSSIGGNASNLVEHSGQFPKQLNQCFCLDRRIPKIPKCVRGRKRTISIASASVSGGLRLADISSGRSPASPKNQGTSTSQPPTSPIPANRTLVQNAEEFRKCLAVLALLGNKTLYRTLIGRIRSAVSSTADVDCALFARVPS